MCNNWKMTAAGRGIKGMPRLPQPPTLHTPHCHLLASVKSQCKQQHTQTRASCFQIKPRNCGVTCDHAVSFLWHEMCDADTNRSHMSGHLSVLWLREQSSVCRDTLSRIPPPSLFSSLDLFMFLSALGAQKERTFNKLIQTWLCKQTLS